MLADAVFIGEVGLAGDIRRVTGMDRRLAEAARLGFRWAMVPPGVKDVPKGLQIITCEDIGRLLQGVQRIADNGGRSKET
jgi:DNA repair protein RadA/Sms